MDLSVAKNPGSDAKGIQNGSGSRFGVRGVEDLGGGMAALFQIETRFDADTGAAQNFNACGLRPGGAQAAPCTNNRFWGARSIVGMRGGFGQVVLGREYTTAFLGTQLIADPWGWDTVAANNFITGLGGIAKVRNDSSLTYNFSAQGFSVAAQIAEATDTINQFDSKPFNFNVGYRGGPIVVAFGYEKTGRDAGNGDEKMWSAFGSYNFGMARVGLYYGRGDALNGATHKGWMIPVVAPIGAGELRASFGNLKANSTKVSDQFSLGYHYNMSKRTTLYADMVRDGKRYASSKTGYDVGIKHNF